MIIKRARVHSLPPAEHARLGWSWGSYRDGICLTLCFDMDHAYMARFRALAATDGATVVDLRGLK